MLQELTAFLKGRKKWNLFIVILNVVIFGAMYLIGRGEPDAGYMLAWGAMLPSAVVQDGETYRLFTSMFLHFGVEHLFFNMLLLIYAGDMLQSAVGAVRYLLIYLGGGLIGNLLSLAVNLWQHEEPVSAGASGAVFAVIGALVWLVLKSKDRKETPYGRGLLWMAALSLIQGFMDTGVDHFAHLGGFLGGFVLAALSEILWGFRRKNR